MSPLNTPQALAAAQWLHDLFTAGAVVGLVVLVAYLAVKWGQA